MIRTGRGPYLSSLGVGIMLAGVLPLLSVLFAALAVLILFLLSVAVLALLLASPAALVLGAFGFLHLEEDGSGFTDTGL